MAIKKYVAVRLGVIYDSQVTNSKQGGLPLRTTLPPATLLLVAWESYVTLSRQESTKHHQKQVEALTF
jgi:hypothetical protein